MKLQTPSVTHLTCAEATHQRDFFCGLAALHFGAVRAEVGSRPHLRMQAAGIGPLVVHRAAAGLGIQQLAIAAAPSGQSEDAVLEATQITEIKRTWMI